MMMKMAMKRTMKSAQVLQHHQQRAFSLSRSSWLCCCLSLSLPTLASAFVYHPPVAARKIGGTRCFLSSTSTSNSMSGSTNSIPLPKLVMGGDFAGLSATFVPTTGELVPIPEYLVPKELLEWGQEPSSLEMIASEDINNDDDLSVGNADRTKSWSRQTVTVFPAVGCGVDNLHTQKEELLWQTIFQEDAVRVAVRSPTAAVDPAKQVWTVEASFGWNPEQLKGEDSESPAPDIGSSSYRVSMQVTATLLQDAAAVLQSPVHVRLERQTNGAVSSRGTIADGGGLDGRQVVQLLGKSLHSQSGFAAEPKTKSAIRWEAIDATAAAKDDSSSSVQLSERVHFPGNLTLAVGSNDGDGDSATVLEVGHITLINDQLSVRHVVQCTLPPTKSSGNHATDLPVVRSWTEEGTIQIIETNE